MGSSPEANPAVVSPDTLRIQVEDLSLSYPLAGRKGQYLAVTDVTFSIAPGERFVIIGPSGCGKTTVLTSLAGFIKPSKGRILLNGHAITGPGPDRAVVFQDFDQLFPWRTIENNLTYALRVTGRAKGKQAEEIARHFLDLVGIHGAKDKYPHQLSGGMKQRAAIARSLSIKPDLLLMDEPFGALDEITRTSLQRELYRICEETGVTLVLVTHSIQEAALLGDRVLIMRANPGRMSAIVDTSMVQDLEGDDFNEKSADLRHGLDAASQKTVRSEVDE